VVPAVKPVRELVNAPVPVPFVVQVLLVEGLADVLQQMPLAVTVAPPSEVTLPPPDAAVWVIDVMAAVVTVGVVTAGVVKVKSEP
jgi:hypothetical protein